MKHITTKAEFEALIKENNNVVIDFYAQWCGPCKMIAPELERVESNIKVVKVDVDEFEDLARTYGVMSIPTLILFDNGKEVKRKVERKTNKKISKKTSIVFFIYNLLSQ